MISLAHINYCFIGCKDNANERPGITFRDTVAPPYNEQKWRLEDHSPRRHCL